MWLQDHACSDLNTNEQVRTTCLISYHKKNPTYTSRWQVLFYSKLEVTLGKRTAVSKLESMWIEAATVQLTSYTDP